MSETWRRILSNFFLDGAKISFGSLVIGAFIATKGSISWMLLFGGLLTTAVFLTAAVFFAQKNFHNHQYNQ